MSVVVKITPNEKGNPPGKLADAELHFIDGELDGLKLIGFAIWERREWRRPQRHVPGTPGRASMVNVAASRCCGPSLTKARRIASAISCSRRMPSTSRRQAETAR